MNETYVASILSAKTKEPLLVGSKTPWGEVKGISSRDGERYYMLINAHGTVSLFPAVAVEDSK